MLRTNKFGYLKILVINKSAFLKEILPLKILMKNDKSITNLKL